MSSLFDIIINGPARFTQAHHFPDAIALAFIIVFLLIEIGAVIYLCRGLYFLALNSQSALAWVLRQFSAERPEVKYSFLRLTFPAATKKSTHATEQLHTLLRNIAGPIGRRAIWKQSYSLEMVATKDTGIYYLVRIPTAQVSTVERMILSFLPSVKVKEVTEDYLAQLDETSSVDTLELQYANDYVLPLGDNSDIADHDTLTYLTGQMRELEPTELVAYQVVVTPVLASTHTLVLRRTKQLRQRIAGGMEISSILQNARTRQRLLLDWTLLLPWQLLRTGARGVRTGYRVLRRRRVLPALVDGSNPYELDVREQAKTKLDQPLFEVSLRLLVVSSNPMQARARLSSLVSSFETLTSSNQSFVVQPQNQRSAARLLSNIQCRSLSSYLLSPPVILSSRELSDLYHLPNTSLTKTEDLVKSRSRELPAPLSMKQTGGSLDVVLGVNTFGDKSQEVGLTRAQRQKHTYIIGKTGTGKTTLLLGAIKQDMENGKGVAVLDPHGDMFRDLLALVPEHRRKDVIVFDPSDRKFPVGFNILDPGVEFANEDDSREWITSAVLSVFSKLAEKSQWGPRMEHILRSTTLTALYTPNPTLFTIQRLLTDKKYQREVAKTLGDPILKQFWEKEFKLMGDMQLSNAVAPLTHRLGHFLTSTMSRHILLQEKSTIRMADIMNEGKILLVNLSKGEIGEDQSFFFGTLLTSTMWMAAYQRTKLPEDERRDFYVYVDEFQNFATPQFGDIMSEGRKFRIALTVSHQTIAQIDDLNLVKVVTANAGTLISLKVSPQDEAFLLPYFHPEVEKGDIVNLAPYHFYMKVTSSETEDAFSGQTIPLDEHGSEATRQAVIAASRRTYALPLAQAAEYIAQLVRSTPKAPTVKRRTARTNAQTEKSE